VRVVQSLALVAFATFACGRGTAREALTATDTAVSSARAEGAKYVPDQFEALSDAAASARSRFDSRDYEGALEAAQAIPARAILVMQAAGVKKRELMESWKAMEGALPAMVTDIQKRVIELAAAKRLPAGLNQTGIETAKTTLEAMTAMWAEAGRALSAGDIMAAVTKGGQVKATAEDLMTALGMTRAVTASAPGSVR
jgi:hypothetical protein